LQLTCAFAAGVFFYAGAAVMTHFAYVFLRRQFPKMTKDRAEKIASIVVAGFFASLATLAQRYLTDLVVKSFSAPAGSSRDELRRRLLSEGPETGEFGNLLKSLAYALSRHTIDSAGRVTVPGFFGGPKIRFFLPDAEFGSNDNSIGVRIEEYKYYPGAKSWGWSVREPAHLTPAAIDTISVKVVSDNQRIWLLAGRGRYGYKIFTKLEDKEAFKTGQLKDVATKALSWHRHEGEAIDIYPGQHYVWLTNSERDIYACAQPCGNHTWIKVRGKAENVAVGPSLNLATKSTKGQPSYVWVKDGFGKVWRRAEADVTGDFWLEMKKAAEIPQRIKDLLNERDSFSDWLDENKFKYPELPFPPHDRR
jgi:hypothetical protein